MQAFQCDPKNNMNQNIDKIKPSNCRTWAESFTLSTIAPRYETFFRYILDVRKGKGWYTKNLDRSDFLLPLPKSNQGVKKLTCPYTK